MAIKPFFPLKHAPTHSNVILLPTQTDLSVCAETEGLKRSVAK